MLPRLGDAGQAGDCVKQFQYVRVFKHCRVRQSGGHAGALVARARTRSLTRFFFTHRFKFRGQNATSASGNEIQQTSIRSL